jgi:hypothetical protein
MRDLARRKREVDILLQRLLQLFDDWEAHFIACEGVFPRDASEFAEPHVKVTGDPPYEDSMRVSCELARDGTYGLIGPYRRDRQDCEQDREANGYFRRNLAIIEYGKRVTCRRKISAVVIFDSFLSVEFRFWQTDNRGACEKRRARRFLAPISVAYVVGKHVGHRPTQSTASCP